MTTSNSSDTVTFAQIRLKLDGADIPADTMRQFYSFEIENTLGLPDMAVVRFLDPSLAVINATTFDAGKLLEVYVSGVAAPQPVMIFKGEIVALEPEFTDLSAFLVVRAYDKLHRLNRDTKFRSFVNVTYSDIVNQVARGAGLTASTDSIPGTLPHVFQDNQTDYAFLQMLAQRMGCIIEINDNQLLFKKQVSTQAAVSLIWGKTLKEFYPRFSLSQQVNQVTVKSWNMMQKQPISAASTPPTSHPTTGITTSGGGALAQSKFSAATLTAFHVMATTGNATKHADSIIAGVDERTIEAEGIAQGNPEIKAGRKVTISEIGDRFGGTYQVTTVTHRYDTIDGYMIHFRVEGGRAKTMADYILNPAPTEEARPRIWAGVYPAVVTNNNDPDGLARVKVKYPWLDAQQETFWARIAMLGAGPNQGFLWVPEVNDEVLVAFEDGDFNRPYVLGGLWNGVDKPPEALAQVITGGKVEKRTIKTRIGHIIRLTDKSGEEKIEILDAQSKTKIILDTANEKLTISSTKDLQIEATGSGAVNVKNGSGALTVETAGKLTLKGSQVEINASGNCVIKGAMVQIN